MGPVAGNAITIVSALVATGQIVLNIFVTTGTNRARVEETRNIIFQRLVWVMAANAVRAGKMLVILNGVTTGAFRNCVFRRGMSLVTVNTSKLLVCASPRVQSVKGLFVAADTVV